MTSRPRPPLSARENPDALQRYMALQDGIPRWMVSGVYSWVRTCFYDSRARTWRRSRLLEAEQVLREPLVWRTPDRAAESLLGLLQNERGLDLLDYCLAGLLDRFLPSMAILKSCRPVLKCPQYEIATPKLVPFNRFSTVRARLGLLVSMRMASFVCSVEWMTPLRRRVVEKWGIQALVLSI